MKIKNKKTNKEVMLVESYAEFLEIFVEQSRRFSGEKVTEGLREYFDKTVSLSWDNYTKESEEKDSKYILNGWDGGKSSHPDLEWVSNSTLEAEWIKV